MPSPRVWNKTDVATVARYAGVDAATVARMLDLMRFCESIPDADVGATCALGMAPVRSGGTALASPVVIQARAG